MLAPPPLSIYPHPPLPPHAGTQTAASSCSTATLFGAAFSPPPPAPPGGGGKAFPWVIVVVVACVLLALLMAVLLFLMYRKRVSRVARRSDGHRWQQSDLIWYLNQPKPRTAWGSMMR